MVIKGQIHLLSEPQKSQLWIKRAQDKHNSVYNYDNVCYINAHTKVDIICPIHGSFSQLPRKHLKGQGCPDCGHASANNWRKIILSDFILRSNHIHNSVYNYDNVCYINAHTKVDIICPIHGVFKQRPSSHLSGHGCLFCSRMAKKCRSKPIDFKKRFLVKAKRIHKNKYSYEKVNYLKSQIPVIIICPIHGEFQQTPAQHLAGSGCSKCGILKLRIQNSRTTKEFIEEAIKIHHNCYDYSKVKYINKQTNIIIKCPEHGQFLQTPHHHLRGQGCPRCQLSLTHLNLKRYINKLGFTAIINDREQLSPLEIDIWVPEVRLGIEIHGLYWHSHKNMENRGQIRRHQNKMNLAKDANIKLLQFWCEPELEDKKNIVYSMIAHHFGLSQRIFARILQVAPISREQAWDFYLKTHLQGFRDGTHFGLIDSNNRLFQMVTFGRHHKYEFELLRSSTKINCSVVGGFSKLLSHFIRSYRPKKLLSYANCRYSYGNVYQRVGFKLLSVTKPGYFYCKGRQIFNRHKFQKHRLNKILNNFNPAFSEAQNMFNNGYRRIWDAGHCKFLRVW